MIGFLRTLSRSGAVLFASLLGGAVCVSGQTVGAPHTAGGKAVESPNTYGTTDLTAYTLNAYAFEAFDHATVYQGDGTGGRFAFSGTNATAEAPVLLPSGAIVDNIELEGCDNDASSNLSARLFACSDGICSIIRTVSTDLTPGCTRVSSTTTSATVNNTATTYFTQLGMPVGSTTSFRAVRIYYKLQVSPGPAVATFADVPTGSPLFKFVEALVAAGVTAGCGGGNYCPGDPVTRGQMAVFLATALGLHFPN